MSAFNAASTINVMSQAVENSVGHDAVNAPMPQVVGMQAVSVIGSKKVGMAPVYNLTVAGREYFANGFLVHNCDALEMAIRLMVQLWQGRTHGVKVIGRV
mgnify:FL=1